MGMRSCFAYENALGVIYATYVHWSTLIDVSLGEALRQTSENKSDYMRRVFQEITKFDSVSSVDTVPASGRYDTNASYTIEDSILTLHNPANEFEPEVFEGDLAIYKMMTTYAEDGLGAMFSEKHPDLITFFTCDVDGNYLVKNITLEDLAQGVKCDSETYPFR